MNRRILNVSVFALVASLILPVALIGSASAAIPNPDTAIWVTIGMPETVDPHWAYDTASGSLIQNVYEPLCIFNGTHTDSFLPAIADWWPGFPGPIIPSPPDPSAPEGTVETWYFHIRQNVPWHDPTYGTVTPEDVEYSFERGMLMDHTAGPMWMLYEPLLVCESSYDYDLDGDGNLSKTEYTALALDIDGAIESNSTHVWFNLKQAYAPFQQILCQTWSEVMCRRWCEDQGLWKKTIAETYGWTSDQAYAEFLRTWDPPEPGPLMEPVPRAMGTGPYKLKAMDPDPHTGYYTLEKFDNYWRGWPAPAEFFETGQPAGGYVKYAIVKCVEEWANRKAQFFSTDPALQADFCAVPRANCPELHVDGNKDGPTLPGFRLIKFATPILDAFYFTFEVNPTTPYPPKLGTNVKLDIFKDRYMRLGFIYCFNFTKFLQDAYLGEAMHPPVCMPPGTAYYNASKPVYDIDLDKAKEYFKKAWGGQAWTNGFTITLVYNIGNTMRQTACQMLEYYIENYIDPEAPGKMDIIVKGEPWSTYLPGMRNRMYVFFTVGWLADFPDPHNWFQPFMHPSGTYCGRQKVDYSYDQASLIENWWPGASYGPPPYTNALGEYVTEINNTYVAHLIDVGVGLPPALRNEVYNELMDIYYAEATQLPLAVTIARHYERTWINGWDKTYNLNPINPGLFFYTIWKGAAELYAADITVTETITNTTKVYPKVQVYLGEMRLYGSPAKINYRISVKYKTGTVGMVLVYIGINRQNEEKPQWSNETYWPIDREKYLIPGGSYSEEVTWYEDSTMWVGYWNISLYGSPTAGAGGEIVYDPSTADNRQYSPYRVEARELFGDIDGTGVVNVLDAIRLSTSFGYKQGEALYDPLCDLNGDKIVNIFDAIILSAQFGKRYP